MGTPEGSTEHHTLLENAVSLGGDWVASVANVAPSSSVAFTLALLVAFSGLASPLAVLVAGIGMLLVAVGYSRLNNWKPHAGAPYIWVGQAVHPVLGYATGILAILAATAANVGNITLAGTYLLGVISPGHTFPKLVVYLISVAVMALVIYVAVRGIRPSIAVQTLIIVFEYAIVILFVVVALWKEIVTKVPGMHAPSLSYFAIHTSSHGFSGLANAAVVCGFLYAGWEAPLVLGEESTKPHFNPGRAAILGVVFLTIWYTFLVVVFQGVAPPEKILALKTDVLTYAGTVLLPSPWSKLLPLAVFSAVFATTQMQLAESSRVTFAMARDRLLPSSLARVHQAFRTPWIASLALGVIPPLALIPYLAYSGATTAIGYIISADGLLYLLMYFIIAAACVWYYRQYIRASTRNLIGSGVVPLIGALFNLVVFVYGLAKQVHQISIVAGVLVVLCLAWALLARATSNAPYFTDAMAVHGREGAGPGGPGTPGSP
jgi:amino acid transporter